MFNCTGYYREFTSNKGGHSLILEKVKDASKRFRVVSQSACEQAVNYLELQLRSLAWTFQYGRFSGTPIQSRNFTLQARAGATGENRKMCHNRRGRVDVMMEYSICKSFICVIGWFYNNGTERLICC